MAAVTLTTGYLALGTALSAQGVLTELSGNGYARPAVTLSYDAVTGVVFYTGGEFGPGVTATWTAGTYLAIFDSLTGGNLLFSWSTAAPALAVGNSYAIQPGQIVMLPSARTSSTIFMPSNSVVGVTALTGLNVTSGPATFAYSAAGALTANASTVPLTDAATITSNGALGTKFSVTLGAATRTLAFPTNVVPGQALTYVLTTSTTSTALTLASGFKTAGGAPTATATAAAIDVWTGWVDNTGTAALGQYLKAFA